jgi:hypothetical protein
VVAAMNDAVKAHKTSEEILAAVKERCKEDGGEGEKLADQPAGETWLMRHHNSLWEEAQRPGYPRIRKLFVAADQLQDFPARHAALLKILDVADTPLLRHRTQIEIAHSALRSGDPEARKIAAAAAAEAHREAQALPKQARADAYLVDAELAIRASRLKESLDRINLALKNDRGYLAAYILRLNAIVMLAPKASAAEKIDYLDQGIESAYFVRKLATSTSKQDRKAYVAYVVDARSAIAEYPVQSDVAALLQFYLGSLADDRDGARRAMAAFLAQCGRVLSCSETVRARAQGLLE